MSRPSHRNPRVALLCDVDQRIYHVGDEAIGLGGARALRERGCEVVMISRGEKHGPDGTAPAEAIRALTFPWPETDRARYLDEIERVLAGDPDALPPEDKLFGIIEQLRGVDALVIGGGGSLNSRYGWLLSERVGTALVASALGKPVVLSGQSIGPDLTPTDAELLGRLLDVCVLAGVRDADSLALARSIRPDHPALVRTVDDAIGLEELAAEALAPRISVTLGSGPGLLDEEDYIRVMAAVVDGLADRTGAPIELVPHMADPDEGGVDARTHELLAAALRHDARARPIRPALETAARQASSQWIVTTRFHPVVFATVSGASALAVPLDRYGRSRIDGALDNSGWTHGSVPIGALWDPETGGPSALLDAVLDAHVAAAPAERADAECRRERLLVQSSQWWDLVMDGVHGTAPSVEALAALARLQPGPDDHAPRQAASIRRLLAPWCPPAPAERTGHPAVGIVMRTKDRPLMLDRAVRDVLSQSLADWALVVVDDVGDAAAVDAVLARYAHEAAGRISVLHRESSTGMESASNAGIAAVEGELIAIHDDDDTWHPAFLQRTVAHLRSHPEDSAVMVRTEIVDEHEEGGVLVEDGRFLSWPRIHGAHLSDFAAVNRTAPIAVLVRRSVHDRIGLYREDLPVVGDYELYLRLLQESHVGFIDTPLAQWRMRPTAVGSASNSMYAERGRHRTVDRELVDARLQEWVDRHGLGLPMFIARTVEDHVQHALEPLREQNARLLALAEESAARLAALEDASARHGRRLDERSAVDLARRGARSARTAMRRVAGSLRAPRRR